MSEQIGARFELGPMDQVAYVVESLEASLPQYETLFGPFRVSESPLEACEYRGKEVSCHLRLAVNNQGPLEIELIEVVGGEAPHREHLEKHGEGLHHVRFRVDDLDRKLAELEAAGFETIFRKRFGPTVAFAYVETPEASGRSIIELLQLPS